MKQLILFLFGAVNICQAQTSVWKVDGQHGSIYLGGTVHLLREQDYPLPKAFDKAYEASERLVFETDPTELQNPDLAQQMMTQSMYGGDTTLDVILSPKTIELLKTACKDLGLPFEMLSKMKPTMLLMTLSMMKMQELGMNAQGVDIHFANLGKQDKKGIQSLETANDQIGRLLTMANGQEEEYVQYALKDLDEMEQFTELINDWRNGTNKNMDAQLIEMKEKYPGSYQSLVVERNNNWIPQLEKFLLDKQKTFILVGTLHMHGPDGLLQQLRRKGYKISQLD